LGAGEADSAALERLLVVEREPRQGRAERRGHRALLLSAVDLALTIPPQIADSLWTIEASSAGVVPGGFEADGGPDAIRRCGMRSDSLAFTSALIEGAEA
jgi:hypothetical protein